MSGLELPVGCLQGTKEGNRNADHYTMGDYLGGSMFVPPLPDLSSGGFGGLGTCFWVMCHQSLTTVTLEKNKDCEGTCPKFLRLYD